MTGWLGSKEREEADLAKAKEEEAKAKADLAEAERVAEVQAEEKAAAKEADDTIRSDEEARLAQVEADAADARRAEMVQMKADEADAAHERTAEAKAALKGDDAKPAARSRKKSGKTYQDLVAEGWTGLAVKAGETRSREILYDPSTHRMELADEQFGEGGAEIDKGEDLPDVHVEDTKQGGLLVMDASVEHDVTMAYRLVPEIRA